MSKLSSAFEPLESRSKVAWQSTTEAKRKEIRGKALQGCRVVCEVIAPKAANELFESICKPTDSTEYDVSAELKLLMSAYRDAPSKNVKTQILSLYAFRFSAEKLIKYHEPYERITHWQIKQARRHAKLLGPGAVDDKPLRHRVRLSMPKVDHFLEFVNRPYFYQDVAYGTRTLKLDSGETVAMPNVVRTVTRSTMINQYHQYCSEEKFTPLSRSTLFKILDVREASQRKCLQGLDNIATDGAAGFELLEKIVDELGESGADLSWCSEAKKKLHSGKRYLKTDFQVHCAKNESRCGDHCRFFALSDDTEQAFNESCDHEHNVVCDDCEALRCIFTEIEKEIQKPERRFYSKDQKEDLIYDFNTAKAQVLEWKSHILRAVNQEKAKQDLMRTIEAGKDALVVMDWAMKFQQRKFREKQSEWFGKRGLSWHISSVITKKEQSNEIEVTTYAHLLDTCNQDWYAVLSILENLLVHLKSSSPSLSKVYLRSDEAGCYNNNNLIAALHDLGLRVGVSVCQFDHSEPQHGKDICDRILCPMKAAIKRFCNEGNDIVCAENMRTALKERPVKGTTAAVCTVNEAKACVQVKKITGFSKYHNYVYEENGVRVWRCYGIGKGKLIPYKALIVKNQGPTDLTINTPFFNINQSRIFNSNKKTSTAKEPEPLFSCTVPGCTESFALFSDLELHLDVGEHIKGDGTTSMYDKIRKEWANRCLSVQMETNTCTTNSEQDKTGKSKPPQSPVAIGRGWALHKGRSGSSRFSPSVREYLTTKFKLGEQTGKKCDPLQVSKDMRTVRDDHNERLFKREEWLSKTQVQSFFSRLARKRALPTEFDLDAEEYVDEDAEEYAERLQEQERDDEMNEITQEIGLCHPIVFDAYNICESHKQNKLASFNVTLLKEICKHYDIALKAKDRKKDLIEKVANLVEECSCGA